MTILTNSQHKANDEDYIFYTDWKTLWLVYLINTRKTFSLTGKKRTKQGNSYKIFKWQKVIEKKKKYDMII